MQRTPESLKEYLKRDELRLYSLIWQRFVASQMAPAVYDTTTVDFDLKGTDGTSYLFRSTGSVVKFQGFTRLYIEATEAGEHRRLDDLERVARLDRVRWEDVESCAGELSAAQRLRQRGAGLGRLTIGG